MPGRFDDFLKGQGTPAGSAGEDAAVPDAPVASAAPGAQGASTLQGILDPSSVPAGAPEPAPLGMPFLGRVGAGAVQGVRDIAQTGANAANWVDPNAMPATAAALQRQTAAFRQRYGSSLPANLAEIASGTLVTAPVTAAAAATLPLDAVAAIPAVGAVAAPAIEGAIAGGGTNALMSGGTGQNPLTAAATGAVGGGAIGAGFGMLGRLGSASGPVQQMAQRLGIDLSYGQRAGGFAKRVEDTTAPLPGSGAASFADQQNQQITGVLARNAGIPGTVSQITTPELNAARQAAGNLIQSNAARIQVQEDPQLWNDLANTENLSQVAGSNTPQANVVRNLTGQITNILANNNGTMGGSDLASFISHNSALDHALNYSGDNAALVRGFAGDIRQALLDNAARSPGTDPGAIADLGQARYQYKVLKSIEPVITKTPDGTEAMSLPALAQSIRRNFDMNQTGPGNDMQDLARLISGPLATLRSSGTAERSLMQQMLGLGGGLGGSGALWALGHPTAAEAALAATGVPYAGGALLGRAMRFGPGMNWKPWSAYQQATNPLAPRLFGPAVGNALLGAPAPSGGAVQ